MPAGTPLAVVTGASGGLGAACARRLATDGYALVLLDRDEAGLEAVADMVGRDGGEASVVVVDLLEEDAISAAISHLPSPERLRALVNVAGLISLGTITDISVEDWDRVLGVKLRGDFVLCRAAIPIMVENGGGAVVKIA